MNIKNTPFPGNIRFVIIRFVILIIEDPKISMCDFLHSVFIALPLTFFFRWVRDHYVPLFPKVFSQILDRIDSKKQEDFVANRTGSSAVEQGEENKKQKCKHEC